MPKCHSLQNHQDNTKKHTATNKESQQPTIAVNTSDMPTKLNLHINFAMPAKNKASMNSQTTK